METFKTPAELKYKRRPYREQAAQVARVITDLQAINGLDVDRLSLIEFVTEVLGNMAVELEDYEHETAKV